MLYLELDHYDDDLVFLCECKYKENGGNHWYMANYAWPATGISGIYEGVTTGPGVFWSSSSNLMVLKTRTCYWASVTGLSRS